jgi:DNA modification methylase
MIPYYQDNAVTIYHGDCREILPQLEPVDLVLTDPPYLNLIGGTVQISGGVAPRINKSVTVGDPWVASLEWVDAAWNLCQLGFFSFCSFQFVAEMRLALPVRPTALLTWYARNKPPSANNAPRFTTEFIWTFQKSPGLNWRALNTLIDIPKLQAGCMATERFLEHDGTTTHPTQKPLSLINYLLQVGGETILDPFMGSGTTLRAAKDLGRKAIGIEIEEKYCEIAAKRMGQEVFKFAVGESSI